MRIHEHHKVLFHQILEWDPASIAAVARELHATVKLFLTVSNTGICQGANRLLYVAAWETLLVLAVHA